MAIQDASGGSGIAESYKGFTIQFGGDTTDLSRRLPSLRRDSSEVERELRAIYRTPELGPGNVELLGSASATVPSRRTSSGNTSTS